MADREVEENIIYMLKKIIEDLEGGGKLYTHCNNSLKIHEICLSDFDRQMISELERPWEDRVMIPKFMSSKYFPQTNINFGEPNE